MFAHFTFEPLFAKDDSKIPFVRLPTKEKKW